MVKLLNQTDVGRVCVYAPGKDWSETGRLKSFNNENQIAWIVFKCGDDWDNFMNYTGQSVKYEDFIFET